MNKSLRILLKLLLNSLSGKVIERIHIDDYKMTGNSTMEDLPEGWEVQSVIGDKVIIKGKKDEFKEFKKQFKPLFYGILIYAYARDHLYKNVLRDYNPIYGDTDSALLHQADLLRL